MSLIKCQTEYATGIENQGVNSYEKSINELTEMNKYFDDYLSESREEREWRLLVEELEDEKIAEEEIRDMIRNQVPKKTRYVASEEEMQEEFKVFCAIRDKELADEQEKKERYEKTMTVVLENWRYEFPSSKATTDLPLDDQVRIMREEKKEADLRDVEKARVKSDKFRWEAQRIKDQKRKEKNDLERYSKNLTHRNELTIEQRENVKRLVDAAQGIDDFATLKCSGMGKRATRKLCNEQKKEVIKEKVTPEQPEIVVLNEEGEEIVEETELVPLSTKEQTLELTVPKSKPKHKARAKKENKTVVANPSLIEAKHRERWEANPFFKERSEAFKTLESKDELASKLVKTKMCKSVKLNKPCKHGDKCRFAHSFDELTKKMCAFGIGCKLVTKYTTEGKFINCPDRRTGKICMYWHPEETDESYKARIDFKCPEKESTEPKKLTIKKAYVAPVAPWAGVKVEVNKLEFVDAVEVPEAPKVEEEQEPVKEQNDELIKTRMCKSILNGRPCMFGSKCRFAHSVSELKKTPCNFKFCRFVIASSDGNYTNKPRTHKVCEYWHEHETDESYQARLCIPEAPKSNPEPQRAVAKAPKAQAPQPKQEPLKKTRMCRSVEEGKRCRYGSKCSFAHKASELVKKQCGFPTCRFFKHPNPKTGKKCMYWHDETVAEYAKRVGIEQ